MSKAPHPKSTLHVVSSPKPLAPMSRDEFTHTYGPPSLQADLDRQRAVELMVSQREFQRWAAERREDEQAKRFWFRGWVATVVAWLRGEA